jgi:hypothetical protein
MVGENDRAKSEPKLENRQEPTLRKPWHAPQFIETDFASTDTMCQAGHDGPGLS